jgi:hypothetical protein
MVEEMHLRRYSQRTQESYLSRVAQLAKHYGKPPEQVSEEEWRQYFVYLTNERKLPRSSVTTALSALKFLYEEVLKQEWGVVGLVRPRAEKKLPVVLSVEEQTEQTAKWYQIPYPASTYTFPREALIHHVGFDEEYIHLELTDGRVLSVPLWWIPSLHNASPADRERYEISRDRKMVIWDPDKGAINDEIRIRDYLAAGRE